MDRAYDPFKCRHKFQDDIWGQIRLSDLERDVIDTPEFQRLFRTSQLGFVDLVYHTANHTRGAHSIGACCIADRLISRLVENTSDLYRAYEPVCPGLYADFEISPTERVLIRLGALLHDISHLPLSHDLEKKSHKIFYPGELPLKLRSWYGHYDKHDDYDRNPLLFILLCDHANSVLARVLRYYSKPFCACLQRDAELDKRREERRHGHISAFVELVCNESTRDSTSEGQEWDPKKDLLPQMLFHLLSHEDPDDGNNPVTTIVTKFGGEAQEWHLGPSSLGRDVAKGWHDAWYQPFRHDIIGNTLSADLIDYLTRDPQHLGTQRRIDLHLLSYYALVNRKRDDPIKRYRCAIDLQDHKRGTTRTFLLNDLFRLLDLRQDIHEKAVMHRVVQSANAMLARGLLLLGKEILVGEEGVSPEDMRPLPRHVVGLGGEQLHALQSEDLLFHQLMTICEKDKDVPNPRSRRLGAARRIFQKLVERRVYRPLVIIPGNWATEMLSLPPAPSKNNKAPDFSLRTLAAIVDSAYYSPFLLFACSCVEKYLQGVFDTDGDLCSYVERVAKEHQRTGFVRRASELVPSHVITWTTPYKQLYKDPAVVVAIEQWVGQIDEAIDPSFQPAVQDESTYERIETAIHDADSKYATLWQLYVFVSDGLFYSGILNKLVNNLPASCRVQRPRDEHEKRLKNAQAFLSLAFRAVCNNWQDLVRSENGVQAKQELLEKRMDIEAFQALLPLWVGLYESRPRRSDKWSTVKVEHYYHEYALDKNTDDELKRPCRDSRYKFDRESHEVWQRGQEDPDSDGYKLLQFLRECHVRDPKLLSETEFEHLVELYKDEETRKRCDSFLRMAHTDHTHIADALKSLWLSDFPWLAPDTEKGRESDTLMGHDAIKRWVLKESEVLRPNVRRRLTEDLEPVVDILVEASAQYGGSVFDDFRLRLQNESTLWWNDVRARRIVRALKRRWGNTSAGISQDHNT